MSSRGTFFLLRGPVLLVGVMASVLWPYLSTWSAQSLAQLLVASIGVIWSVADLIKFLESYLRLTLSKILNHFVLDDFLRSLFDVETGVVPCTVGSFVGASSMYGLRMDEDQRTKLVQASLWTTKEEAHSILLEAGGIKSLLPESITGWLDDEMHVQTSKTTEHKPRAFSVETVEEAASDSSTISECPHKLEESRISGSSHCDEIFHSGIPEKERRKPDEVCFEGPKIRVAPGMPTDPVAVMFSIVRDMAMEKMRPLFASIPESKVEMVGTVAAMGLCAQFLLRFRSKRSTWGSLSALCLSGTVAGAFSTILLRQAVLGTVHDATSLKTVFVAILSRSFERIKHLIAEDKRWQTAFALTVLSLLGKRNPSVVPPHQMRWVVPP